MNIQTQQSQTTGGVSRKDGSKAEPIRIGGVMYPSYLILWDMGQEGEAAVRERILRRDRG